MTYVVNSTADEANASPTSTVCASAGSGLCTLRAAIQAANNNPGTDTILLSTPGVYRFSEARAGRGEDMAATGDLDILDAVTIAGAGAGSVIIDGNQLDRVFDVSANGTTTISGVTIRNGNPGAGDGGGISSGATATNQVATLNLINVVVTQNTPGGFGGGIANTDVLSLTDATVSDNTSGTGSGFGGGIYNAGTATLNRVTVSGNAAGGGGGLGSDFDITLTNVTISGNTASSGAALMHNGGQATLVNVTISNNTADPMGGAVFNLGDATFKYTIFAHVPANEACNNFGTSFVSGGHNIDVGTSCEVPCSVPSDCPTGTTCTNNLCRRSGDLINTDPALAPLGNYGGPTLTQALLSGSPAIDAGGSDCPPPTTDQRGPGHCSGTPTTTCTGNTCPSGQACVGHCSTTLTTSCTASGNCPVGETCVLTFLRPVGTHCDIGAFESNGTVTTTSSSSTTSSTSSTSSSTTSSSTSSSTTITTSTSTSSTSTTMPACILDVDGNGTADVSTDVVYINRHLLLLTPVPPSYRVIDPTIPPDMTIDNNVNDIRSSLDVDMNGRVEASTDIVYIRRRLLGLTPVPPSFRILDPTIPSDTVIAQQVDALCHR